MEVYTKASSVSSSDDAKEPCEVQIKSGKKIRACISQTLKLLQTNKNKVLISGIGPTVTKAITTAEIVKRKIKGLYQQNTLFYSKTEDLWEPKDEGLDKLKVTRNVPSISILLSYQPLDDKAPGFQAPGVSEPLIQFRDEDIDLADEKHDGKHVGSRQSQRQHKTRGEKTGSRKDQRTKTPTKQQLSKITAKRPQEIEKEHKYRTEQSSSVPKKDSKRKRGGHHTTQESSKRPYSNYETSHRRSESNSSSAKNEAPSGS